jgi:hypothetical protein
VTPQYWNGTAWVPTTSAAPFPVTTSAAPPSGVTTTMTGGSIAAQNTFQSILAASATRRGCTIQNTATVSDTLFLFFGANGSATKPTSIQLAPGQAAYCTTQNGQPLTDNVSATCADATPANCTWVVGAQ